MIYITQEWVKLEFLKGNWSLLLRLQQVIMGQDGHAHYWTLFTKASNQNPTVRRLNFRCEHCDVHIIVRKRSIHRILTSTKYHFDTHMVEGMIIPTEYQGLPDRRGIVEIIKRTVEKNKRRRGYIK